MCESISFIVEIVSDLRGNCESVAGRKYGLLDEIQITVVRDRLKQLAELDKRRQTIISSLTERDLLDKKLRDALVAASNLTIHEDIYLPYCPKRRTRSSIAREKGLEPLARSIFQQNRVRLK